MTGHKKFSDLDNGRRKPKSIVYTEHPEYVREFLVTCCAYADGDLVPTCLFAAIKPPDDLPNEEVPQHIRELMAQIVNEMPMHMARADAYGTRPNKGDLFWECAPNPVEVEAEGEVAWLSDSELLQRLHALGSSTTSFLDVRVMDDGGHDDHA